MRIVIAPDSLKECLPARLVAEAIAEGVRRAAPDAELVLAPLADGGEGTVDALVTAAGGDRVALRVTGPVGEPIEATYALVDGGKTAVVEMAAASGLAHVPLNRRDPKATTTYGTGELIAHALDHGVAHVILGLGGSGTNDGGAGMAQALGYRLIDEEGRDCPLGGAGLMDLARIDPSERHPRIEECSFDVACDVDNPLCGERGAARVYAAQKGASAQDVDLLDRALSRLGDVITRDLGVDVREVPGAGAAGGLGGGAMAFLGGRLRPGLELVAEAAGLDAKLEGAGLVFTAEGQIDEQTIYGKTPVGVARRAQAKGAAVIALGGTLREGYQSVYDAGVDAVFPIAPGPVRLAESLNRAEELLANTAESVMRLWLRAATQRG